MKKVVKKILDSNFVARVLETLDRRSENRMTEFGMLAQAFEFSKINNVSGDYLEFGVWRGKTFKYAFRMAKRYRCNEVKFLAFDSFEGLPEIESDSDYEIWQLGQFSCSQDEFEGILRNAGIKKSSYELIPGFFDDSLTQDLANRFKQRDIKARVVYIDCDLYESTVPVLRFLTPFLQDGTIVCFDDYYNYRGLPGHGEQRAIAEYLEQNNTVNFIPYFDYSPLGKSFIVQIEARTSE